MEKTVQRRQKTSEEALTANSGHSARIHHSQGNGITSRERWASYQKADECREGNAMNKKTIWWAAASLSAIAFFSLLPDIRRYIRISTM
jgi:hypothetical protein